MTLTGQDGETACWQADNHWLNMSVICEAGKTDNEDIKTINSATKEFCKYTFDEYY